MNEAHEGTTVAVSEAARLDEIGFPEFTTKLVTDVFDALVSANLRQTESFIELLQQTSKSLTDFINDTRDDISGEQILQFLTALLPEVDANNEVVENGTTKVVAGGVLTPDDAKKLNDALEIEGFPAVTGSTGPAQDNQITVPAASGTPSSNLSADLIKTILTAVANRIAANKYSLLREMFRQGLLRLVVEDGVIETRLTFNTYGSSYYNNNTSEFQRKDFNVRARARTGWALSKWVSAAASTGYTSVSVNTAHSSSQDRSGSSVQIFGMVRINFKTDFLPLAG
ncbi:MAG: hypothetical protein U1A22_05795 [Xanthomonadaceae bacterium]|nr:hypothetical protein [Xanthomonadaceae bacterium]